jgi:hypothetical protein
MPTPVENSHAMGGFHRFLSHPSKKAAWERHLTPLPEDLLKAVSPLVDPRWIVRLLWYASLLLFLGGLVYASWVILWTLFRVPPTPPLNF